MLTFEQIYDSIPFEDEQGNIIPHDKVAKEAAYKYGMQAITEILKNADVSKAERPLTPKSIHVCYSEAILIGIKCFEQ